MLGIFVVYTVFREAAIPIFLETRELPVDPLHITADVPRRA
jgi:hypothetical protein